MMRYGMMRCGKFAFWLLVVLNLAAVDVRGQSNMPAFDVDVVGVRGEEGASRTRVDVYTRIPLDNLQFIRSTDGFKAEYQVAAEFYELRPDDRRGNRVQTRVWERTVTVEQFSATQSDRHFDAITQSLQFNPGRYLMEIEVEDQANGRTWLQEIPLDVRDLNKPVAISDLIIIDGFDETENTISPSVSNRVGTDGAGFRYFYELYAAEPVEVRVTSEVMRVKQASSTPSIRSIFRSSREDDGFGEVAYVRPEATRLAKGRRGAVAEIPAADLGAGQYVIRLTVEDSEGNVLDQTQKAVTIEWSGLAEHIQNLNDAIAQLQYIAKDKDVRYIRDGRNEAERLARFREFWKKRDPTPSTDRNENMEEYYYRISFANRKYGSLIDGWKTDRGNVMVRFGEPDHVERRPFNFDVEPYEVWYYYRLGKRFIFIDKNGLGDYQLWVPIWDERNRIR